MKKILSLMLVAIMLLTTILLTSCDLFGTDTTTTTTTQKQDPPKEARTTVSEEEWNKMDDLTNFTYVMKQGEYSMTYAVADTKLYIDYLGAKQIIDINAKLLVGESSIGWLAANMPDDVAENYKMNLGSIGMVSLPDYEEMVYDEESKAYIKDYSYSTVKFCFENGVLSYCKYDMSSEAEEAYIEIKDVGKTTVPQYGSYINISDGKVEPNPAPADARTTLTEEEWNACMALNNFTFSVNTISGTLTGGNYMVYKVTEDARLYTYDNAMGIEDDLEVIIEGVYYTIIEKDGNIYARKTQYTVPENVFAEILNMGGEGVPEFTYDAENRYYYFDGEEAGIYIYFENGVITQFVIINKNDDLTMEMICPVYDIGTTEIDIPEYEIEPEELEFELNDEGTGYIVTDMGTYQGTEVVIPAEYKGLPVVAIDSNAFAYELEITSIVIPNTVTYIDHYAFANCTSLQSIVIPNSVTEIGSFAFLNCTSLETVILSNNLNFIQWGTFENCTNLSSIVIPLSVERIDDSAFNGCVNLSVKCEATSRPELWEEFWNYVGYNDEIDEPIYAPVQWGYVAE